MPHGATYRRLGFNALLLCALTFATAARGQSHFWDGGGADNNWSTAGNWVVNMFVVPPPTVGAGTVIMQGTLRPTPVVNVDYDILSLQFSGGGGAGPFNILSSGGADLFIRDGGIINNDTDLQTIGNVSLGASHTWNAASGPLRATFVTLGSTTTARALTVTGAFDTTITGNIFGAGGTGGGSIILSSSANLQLGGTPGVSSNTFTGPITVNSGTLLLNKLDGGVAVPADLVIGDGVGSDVVKLLQHNQLANISNVTINSSGLLDLNSFEDDFASLTMTAGTFSANGSFVELPLITTNASASSARIFAQDLDVSSYVVADGAATDDLIVQTGFNGIGANGFAKNGVGQMHFLGTALVSNAPIGAIVNAGTLLLSTDFQTIAGLTVGDGVGGAGADVLHCEIGYSLKSDANVLVKESGRCDFDGQPQRFAGVSLTGGQMELGGASISMSTFGTEPSALTAQVAGGTIQLAMELPVPAILSVADGAAAVDLGISSALKSTNGLIIGGGGAIVLSGPQNHPGGVTINPCTITFSSDVGGGSFISNLTSDAFVKFGVTQHMLTLNVLRRSATIIPGGSRLLVTRSLFVDTTDAVFDINEHAAIIDYNGASPLTSIQSTIASAYNGGAWDGFGITSSVANGSQYAVGYAESSAIFGSFPAMFLGEQVDDTAVLIRLTLYGDANLSGSVNSADFNILATSFGTTNKFWQDADFTFDGSVNGADFNLLATNFGASLAGGLGVNVPEAGTIAAIVLQGMCLFRRRHC